MGIGAAVGPLVGAGASLLGGYLGNKGAKQAGGQMSSGALQAAMIQQQMFQQVQQSLAPFQQYGTNALQSLSPLIGTAPGTNPMTAELTSRFAPTMERLEQTPGYQFILDQGLRSTQNSFAARGLGTSGNALRGAADYATGLASNTFQQQFGNYWGENKSIYDMLSGAGMTGLNAANIGAGAAANFGNMIGNSLQSAGNAQGQATIAGTNALTKGIGGAYGLLNANPPSWWGGGGQGGGGYSPSFSSPEMSPWYST